MLFYVGCLFLHWGAYTRNVVVVIKMGAYIYRMCIFYGCLLSRFYGMVYGKMKAVLVCMADTQDSDRSSLVPRSSTFYCSSVCIQCNTRKRKSSKQQGWPKNTYHVNDVWWTWGGHMGGGAHLTNSFAINHRATFLPVELSTINLMNVWGPGYRWSTRW